MLIKSVIINKEDALRDDKTKTKQCKVCGRELSLDNFRKIYNKAYVNTCIECQGRILSEKRQQKRLANGEVVEVAMIERKFKKISFDQVLHKNVSGISHIARDEKFVRILDCKHSWGSNYGRVIVKDDDGVYRLLKPSRSRTTGELSYTLCKNIYIKSKNEFGHKKEKVLARDLVIKLFIINYDMKNNTECWRMNGDVEDNYYKNLYPVTQLQYQEIKNRSEKNGFVTEDEIIEIVNQEEYKPEEWKARYYNRTYNGVGYMGGRVDYKSDAWSRWTNMMQRCYNKKVLKKKPEYRGCRVCEEWQNFQNFKIWYDDHCLRGRKVDLDKDLLGRYGKLYSPETCSFITHFLNTVFERRNITIKKDKDGMYSAKMSIVNKIHDIGTFETEEEAMDAFIEYKKNYIAKLAESYKGKIQDCVYDAMMSWDIAA